MRACQNANDLARRRRSEFNRVLGRFFEVESETFLQQGRPLEGRRPGPSEFTILQKTTGRAERGLFTYYLNLAVLFLRDLTGVPWHSDRCGRFGRIA
jgi:hypothetical protein